MLVRQCRRINDELIISDCDGGFAFHPAEHERNAVALLIERPVILDRYPII